MDIDKSRQICGKMLQDRGYIIEDETEDEFLVIKPDNSKAIVFFQNGPKLSIGTLQEYITKMDEEKIDHCIIIYEKKYYTLRKGCNREKTRIYNGTFSSSKSSI